MSSSTYTNVPPGFRFHPTDEELVDYYLRKKITSTRIDLDVIKDIDLYRIEPWDLSELCKIGNGEQNEWYFFSHKDKKYPSGTRTNRATKAGFWKATGRDKAIYSKLSLVGMRKTLVFYKGRAPNGLKSDFIMHEYRLETIENGTPQEEGWVVCRVFKKRIATTSRKEGDHDYPFNSWYDQDQVSFMPEFDYPATLSNPYPPYNHQQHRKELDPLHSVPFPHDHHSFLQLPQLESPKIPQLHGSNRGNSGRNSQFFGGMEVDHDQVTDWRVLDKFVATQLSQGDGGGEEMRNYSNAEASLIQETEF